MHPPEPIVPRALFALALLLSGCDGGEKPADSGDSGADSGDSGSGDSGAGDSGSDLDPATVPLTGECGTDVDYGGIAVTLETDETTVYGVVADNVVPASVLETVASEGDCVVLRRNNPFCEPACNPGYTCTFDGECIPYPANQDLGTVTLAGMVQAVTMEPEFPGNTYYDTSLPHPGYAAGALLTLSMPAGVYGPAELHGVGVEDLDMAGVEWVLAAGSDLTVTWPAPVGPIVRSEIAIRVAIDQHGVSPSSLRCVFVDDGEGTVPGALVQTLVDLGVTGYPNGTIERRTADKVAAGAGCMDFVVTAPRDVDVDVLGHTPCMSTADCPDGQECNEELQRCE